MSTPEAHDQQQDIEITRIQEQNKAMGNSFNDFRTTMNKKIDELAKAVNDGFSEQKINLEKQAILASMAIEKQNDRLEKEFVKQKDFNDIKRIVYAFIGLIVITVLGIVLNNNIQ